VLFLVRDLFEGCKNLVIHLKCHYNSLIAKHLVQPLLHNILAQFDDGKISYFALPRLLINHNVKKPCAARKNIPLAEGVRSSSLNRSASSAFLFRTRGIRPIHTSPIVAKTNVTVATAVTIAQKIAGS